MPPPLNLTGRTFGDLAVVGRAGRVKYGRWQQGWLCRCKCRAELVVPQDRLPHSDWIASVPGRAVTACDACRGQPCAVCGANVPLSGGGHGRKATCSPECADARRKARGRASFARRLRRDPDLCRRMAERRRQKAAADPEYAARLRDQQGRLKYARQRERATADPEYAEAMRRKGRETYARHAERIQAERRARLDALTPAELQAWCERARRYTRDWRRKHQAALKANPEEYARFRDIQNEYRRRWHALKVGPPPVRECVVCGEAFESRKFRVLCGGPECLAAYGRDKAAASRGRAALASFLEIERQLNEVIRDQENRPRTAGCPDRL